MNDAASSPTPITTTDQLVRLCEALAAEPFVAVDTEFMRDRTFWPKLCLVQVAGERVAAAIDPLALDIDLAPLHALMVDPGVLKVFHAARQDLEIFWHLTGRVPGPLFDTQLAAMVCGHGEEVGYETLVAKIARARIDKSSRFTDWSHRPLSAAQLRYALADVIHLRTVWSGPGGARGSPRSWPGSARPRPTSSRRSWPGSGSRCARATRASSPWCASWPRGASARRNAATCRATALCGTTC